MDNIKTHKQQQKNLWKNGKTSSLDTKKPLTEKNMKFRKQTFFDPDFSISDKDFAKLKKKVEHMGYEFSIRNYKEFIEKLDKALKNVGLNEKLSYSLTELLFSKGEYALQNYIKFREFIEGEKNVNSIVSYVDIANMRKNESIIAKRYYEYKQEKKKKENIEKKDDYIDDLMTID